MSAPARVDDTPTQSGIPVLTMRSTLILVCVLYTLLTVTSSSLALLRGIETDTHLHLLARFAVTWGFGRIEPLHPDAYRDITLNFTTIYIGVAGLLLGLVGWRRRHTS